METNGHVHIPVALPQEKNPLLAHWVGGSSSPSVDMELAAKKIFRHPGVQNLILR